MSMCAVHIDSEDIVSTAREVGKSEDSGALASARIELKVHTE